MLGNVGRPPGNPGKPRKSTNRPKYIVKAASSLVVRLSSNRKISFLTHHYVLNKWHLMGLTYYYLNVCELLYEVHINQTTNSEYCIAKTTQFIVLITVSFVLLGGSELHQ